MNGTAPTPTRVALVTGGARGIGRAIVLALARDGLDVAFTYARDADAAARTARDVKELGRRVLARPSDAARADEAEKVVEATRAELGRIDVVVENAGIVGPDGWERIPADDWHRVLDVNLLGPYFAVTSAAAELRRTRGSAVLVASIAASSAYPEELVYSASKAGVVSLARSLAYALAPEVRVNALAPGWVRTDMTRALHTRPKAAAEIVRGIPAGRWGEPEDVAAAAVFLASDGARFVTGETLVVDGGDSLVWTIGAER